jgi:hypothetical protein
VSRDIYARDGKVNIGGIMVTPMEARQRAAAILAAATLADGIDCANAWHNDGGYRATTKCPECRPPGAAPVAHVEALVKASSGMVHSGRITRYAERMTDGTVLVYTSRTVRDATKAEAASYIPV